MPHKNKTADAGTSAAGTGNIGRVSKADYKSRPTPRQTFQLITFWRDLFFIADRRAQGDADLNRRAKHRRLACVGLEQAVRALKTGAG